MSRAFRVLVAVVAITGMFASIAATCAAAATNGLEMACCQSIHQECGHTGGEADCCATTSPSQQQITIARPDPRSAPIHALPPAVSLSHAPAIVQAPARLVLDVLAAHGRAASAPPPYIAFSALLI